MEQFIIKFMESEGSVLSHKLQLIVIYIILKISASDTGEYSESDLQIQYTFGAPNSHMMKQLKSMDIFEVESTKGVKTVYKLRPSVYTRITGLKMKAEYESKKQISNH